jgi:hypothetical protein
MSQRFLAFLQEPSDPLFIPDKDEVPGSNPGGPTVREPGHRPGFRTSGLNPFRDELDDEASDVPYPRVASPELRAFFVPLAPINPPGVNDRG